MEVDFGLGGELGGGGALELLLLLLAAALLLGGGGTGGVFEGRFGGTIFFQGAALDDLEFLAGGAEFAGEFLDGVFL